MKRLKEKFLEVEIIKFVVVSGIYGVIWNVIKRFSVWNMIKFNIRYIILILKYII